MATFNFTIADANFADGQSAKGTDVSSRTNQIRTFLIGNNLDPTDNIKVSVAYPWTARHSWTVSDASNDNMALTVGAVMAANKYGFHIASAAVQINSAMEYIELTNASSTTPCSEVANAGSGEGYKATQSGTGSSLKGNNSSASNTAAVADLTQAGTGPLVGGSLRSLTGLNAVVLSKVITSLTTVDNTATETAISDLVVTLPANFLKAGTTIRGKIFGQIDTPGAAVPSARVKLYYGGTSGTAILDSGAVTHTISLVNSLVVIEFMMTCLTTGGSGTVEAQGMITWGSNTVPANRGLDVAAATGATNDTTFTIDTTAQKDLTVAFKWGSAVSGSTFKARSGYVEILK